MKNTLLKFRGTLDIASETRYNRIGKFYIRPSADRKKCMNKTIIRKKEAQHIVLQKLR